MALPGATVGQGKGRSSNRRAQRGWYVPDQSHYTAPPHSFVANRRREGAARSLRGSNAYVPAAPRNQMRAFALSVQIVSAPWLFAFNFAAWYAALSTKLANGTVESQVQLNPGKTARVRLGPGEASHLPKRP
eukprot:1834652-Rhodomonas_salina.1